VFFLITVLVEKILRVQPDVKKIYLPVRAADAAAAKRRVETEVCIFLSILSPVKHARRPAAWFLVGSCCKEPASFSPPCF
jgi:hypothetical protein